MELRKTSEMTVEEVEEVLENVDWKEVLRLRATSGHGASVYVLSDASVYWHHPNEGWCDPDSAGQIADWYAHVDILSSALASSCDVVSDFYYESDEDYLWYRTEDGLSSLPEAKDGLEYREMIDEICDHWEVEYDLGAEVEWMKEDALNQFREFIREREENPHLYGF